MVFINFPLYSFDYISLYYLVFKLIFTLFLLLVHKRFYLNSKYPFLNLFSMFCNDYQKKIYQLFQKCICYFRVCIFKYLCTHQLTQHWSFFCWRHIVFSTSHWKRSWHDNFFMYWLILTLSWYIISENTIVWLHSNIFHTS